MKIYRIEWGNPDKYLTYFADFTGIDTRIFLKRGPLPDNWKFPSLKKFRGKFINVDFPKIFSQTTLLLMNENTWQIVNKPLMASGQSYSILIQDKPYRICFPWHIIKSVNNDDKHNPYFFKIKQYGETEIESFDPIVLNGQFPLFQFERSINLFAIESKKLRMEGLDFKYLVRKNKLTGLIFRKVWENDDIE